MRRVLCSASAGTGKTTSLCEEIAEAVAKGLDPARLLGTTFTTKAAAELKARVQERLLRDEALPLERRVESAERLELAALGTVHSVGHKLLQRYALRLDLSPHLQVLDEVAAERLLDEALGLMPTEGWSDLVTAGRRLDIRDPKKLVKALLDLQRSNCLSDQAVADGLATSADRVCELLAPEGTDPAAGDLEALYRKAREVHDRIEALGDTTAVTEGALRRLKGLVAKPSHTWRDAGVCMGLKAGKTSGADRLLAELRAAATQLRRAPALHQDVREYASRLAAQTAALGQAYEGRKRQAGLLDFADLEALFLRLLEHPAVAADLQASYDLVVVDEFQDTNPLQLALFARLHQLLGNSVWVGDEKQAIYGFRGADSELMEDTWAGGEAVFGARAGAPDLLAEALRASGDEHRRLEANYRTQAGLLDVFNAVFEPVFGAEATLRAAQEQGQLLRPPAPRGLERWRLATKNQIDDCGAVAVGVRQLRDEGVPLRDIAVLARTNKLARDLGEALKAQGLPVVTPLPGLLATRECAVAFAGLRVVADRRDGVACAEVLHLLGDGAAGTPEWLERRLREVEAGGGGVPFFGDPLLARLEAVPARSVPPADVVAAVITALDLPRRVATWGGAGQRLANLDALLRLARRLEQRAVVEGRAATAAGLAADLADAKDRDQDEFPVPHGLDAVTVLTYHGAKGLEWPVVVLTGLDFEAKPDVWRARAHGGDARRGKPLEGRALRAWIWPFGANEGRHPQKTRGTGLDEAALQAPEGIALAQAEQQEARRLLYVGMTRARDRLVLAHRWNAAKAQGDYPWLAQFAALDLLAPPHLEPGEHALPGCRTTVVLRDLAPAEPQAAPGDGRWVADPPAAAPTEVPRYLHPSAKPPVPAAAFGPPVALGLRARWRHGRDEEEYQRLGNAVHAYLGALPSLEDLAEAAHLQVAERCLRNFGCQDALPAAELVAVGDRLRSWVAAAWPGAVWHAELQVTAATPEGAQWVGTLDLLLELPDGSVVILDHKSTERYPEGWAVKAAEHSGQLLAYRRLLEAQGLRVAGCWVHFPLAGGAVPMLP